MYGNPDFRVSKGKDVDGWEVSQIAEDTKQTDRRGGRGMMDSTVVRINASDIVRKNKIDLRFQRLEILIDVECKILYANKILRQQTDEEKE